MRKQSLVFLVLVLAVIGISTITSLHSQGQKASGAKAEAATPVQEGVMSDKQKEHSKLYRKHKGIGKLTDLVKREGNNTSDGLEVIQLPPLREVTPGGRISVPGAFLNTLAGSADAVVIGTVTDKTSQLTENGTFVFTDYDLTVEEVLKSRDASIQPQGSIVVTRPGGRILLQGRVVSAVDRVFHPFSIGGRYLLFLKFLPSTGAYHAVSDQGSFRLINNKKVELLTDSPDVPRIEKDAASFIGDVQTAIAVTYVGRQGGIHE